MQANTEMINTAVGCWGEHSTREIRHGKIRKKWRELGCVEGTKENIPRMGDGMGEVENAEMPSGSSGKKLGSCLSDKSMLTVVLQLFICTIRKTQHPV